MRAVQRLIIFSPFHIPVSHTPFCCTGVPMVPSVEEPTAPYCFSYTLVSRFQLSYIERDLWAPCPFFPFFSIRIIKLIHVHLSQNIQTRIVCELHLIFERSYSFSHTKYFDLTSTSPAHSWPPVYGSPGDRIILICSSFFSSTSIIFFSILCQFLD